MTCQTPKDCGDCPACKSASDAYEKQLDQIQELVEIQLRDVRASLNLSVVLNVEEFELNLGAAIVNSLESAGWLNLK